ncbi:hypothetical protein LZS97_21285, partial [Vibrio fluvialis]|uniref:hypothetical protein n=1 Tax=Vibrio fluvialis TaxID=676 RepID=UPI001F45269E
MGCLAPPMKYVSGLVWCGLLRFRFNEPRGFGKAHQILFAGTKSIQKVPFTSWSLAGTVLGVPDA